MTWLKLCKQRGCVKEEPAIGCITAIDRQQLDMWLAVLLHNPTQGSKHHVCILLQVRAIAATTQLANTF